MIKYLLWRDSTTIYFSKTGINMLQIKNWNPDLMEHKEMVNIYLKLFREFEDLVNCDMIRVRLLLFTLSGWESVSQDQENNLMSIISSDQRNQSSEQPRIIISGTRDENIWPQCDDDDDARHWDCWHGDTGTHVSDKPSSIITYLLFNILVIY